MSYRKFKTSFLDIAEIILRDYGKAMSSEHIVQLAISQGILITRGLTPSDSMRARLSEDLRQRTTSSRFKRTAPNMFALREWEEKEYLAPKFVKHISGENVACVRQEHIDNIGRFFGYSESVNPWIDVLNRDGIFLPIDRREAESRDDLKQLLVYILLRTREGLVLSFRRGSYTTVDNFLKGAVCLGFGGHILADELFSFFRIAKEGIKLAAAREISEELKDLVVSDLRFIGMINDDSSPNGHRHLAFVLEGILPNSFDVSSQPTERSVNELKLNPLKGIWNSYHELEFWSQMLCQQRLKQSGLRAKTKIKSTRSGKRGRPLIIVGGIASGKSTIAAFLHQKHGFHVVSTRACVQDLIGLPDFELDYRYEFQSQASKLVSSETGLQALVNRISRDIDLAPTSDVVIDGVRNVGTLSGLKNNFPGTSIIFVETPRDMSLRFYLDLYPAHADVHEFRQVRAHGVEQEVPLLKFQADAIVYNCGTLEELCQSINKWLNNH